MPLVCGLPSTGPLLDQGDGGALVCRRVRARAALELDRRDDAENVTLDAGSSATFRLRLRRGRSRLRVVMPTSQTAPGYPTGKSKVLTVRRT